MIDQAPQLWSRSNVQLLLQRLPVHWSPGVKQHVPWIAPASEPFRLKLRWQVKDQGWEVAFQIAMQVHSVGLLELVHAVTAVDEPMAQAHDPLLQPATALQSLQAVVADQVGQSCQGPGQGLFFRAHLLRC